MKIGIDARMFGPKQGGLGRYTQQLITHLEKIDTNDDFVIFLRADNWNEYKPNQPRFKKVLADVPWYGWKEQVCLSKIIKKQKIDLMHFPHWNVPLFYNKPFVVTIHDLLLLHYPTREASTLGPASYFFKQIVFKQVLRHAARKAKKIITVSEFSKNDIIKTLRISPHKISVTYPAPFMAEQKIANVDSGHSIPTQKYVLYVGVAYPHKNLPRLLEAWKIFKQKYGTDHKLVLAGKEDFFYKKLKKQYETSSLSAPDGRTRENGGETQSPSPIAYEDDSVIFAGFVPDTELPALYSNASLYVFPSLYEGFGIPPLEAMSRGLPVIASNQTCLPEILKDAALYFDPENPEAIAQSIYRALTDQTLRATLLNNGQKLYSTYSWTALARQTSKIYHACG